MKAFRRFVLLFFSFCILLSCGVEHNITGQYIKTYKGPKYFPSSYNLVLNKDSTYIYKYYSWEYIEEKSFGTWEINSKGKKLILNSYIPNLDSIPIVVSESRNNNLQQNVIIFNKPMRDPIKRNNPKPKPDWYNPELDSMHWVLILNKETFPIQSDSIFIPKGVKVNNFYFLAYADFEGLMSIPVQDTVKSETYYVKSENNNVYNVVFPFPKLGYREIFYCRPLKDTLKIKSNSLVWEKWKVKLKKVEEQSK